LPISPCSRRACSPYSSGGFAPIRKNAKHKIRRCRGGGRHRIRPQVVSPASPAPPGPADTSAGSPPTHFHFPSTVERERRGVLRKSIQYNYCKIHRTFRPTPATAVLVLPITFGRVGKRWPQRTRVRAVCCIYLPIRLDWISVAEYRRNIASATFDAANIVIQSRTP